MSAHIEEAHVIKWKIGSRFTMLNLFGRVSKDIFCLLADLDDVQVTICRPQVTIHGAKTHVVHIHVTKKYCH